MHGRGWHHVDDGVARFLSSCHAAAAAAWWDVPYVSPENGLSQRVHDHLQRRS